MNFDNIADVDLIVTIKDNTVTVTTKHGAKLKEQRLEPNIRKACLTNIKNTNIIYIENHMPIRCKITNSKMDSVQYVGGYLSLNHTNCRYLNTLNSSRLSMSYSHVMQVYNPTRFNYLNVLSCSTIDKVVTRYCDEFDIENSEVRIYDVKYTKKFKVYTINQTCKIGFLKGFVSEFDGGLPNVQDVHLNREFPSSHFFENGTLLDLGNDVINYLVNESI